MAEPAAAFGPAGSTGEQNLSVIVAPIREGFELRSLGEPHVAAQRFLDNTIAPLGSDLTAQLIDASSRRAPTLGPHFSAARVCVPVLGPSSCCAFMAACSGACVAEEHMCSSALRF